MASTTPTAIASSWNRNACWFKQNVFGCRLNIAIVIAIVTVVVFVSDDDLW